MGTAFAGIVRTPLTSVIMIFEMTRDYSIIVPLMISNLISFFISRQLQPEPIYEALALQEGVYLPTAESRETLTGRPLSEIMSADAPLISADSSIETAKNFLAGQKTQCVARGRRQNRSRHHHKACDRGRRLLDSLVRDLIKPDTYPYVHPDHPLGFALERMRNAKVDVLPVVSRANIRELCGIISQKQILREYGV